MNPKSVNLIFPGLFKSFQKSELNDDCFPAFNLIQSFISKSNYIETESTPTLGFKSLYLDNYPLASYENADDISASHNVLYAEPISIEVKSDHIVAFPVSIESSASSRLNVILEKFNQHFLPDGLLFKCLSSGRIVCLSSIHMIPKMIPAYSVYGRDIKHFLPEGESAKFWLRVFNEVQMFLHEYINEDERVFNKKLLNGFWFWGNGVPEHESIESILIGEAEWIKGFNRLNKFKQKSLFDIPNCREPNIHLIDESLLLPSSCGDVEAWLVGLKAIESKILKPLYEFIKNGEIDTINIHDSECSYYQMKNIHRYRFYRKTKLLKQLCEIEE